MESKRFENKGFVSMESEGLVRVGNRDSIKVGDRGNYTKRILEPVKQISKIYNSKNELVGIDIQDLSLGEVEVVHNRGTGETIVILKDKDGRKYKGVSKCHPDDLYSPQMGYNLAKLRARVKMYSEKLKEYEYKLENEFWATFSKEN